MAFFPLREKAAAKTVGRGAETKINTGRLNLDVADGTGSVNGPPLDQVSQAGVGKDAMLSPSPSGSGPGCV